MNDSSTIRTVGVLGSGLMGSGIAQACVQAGFQTIVRDVTPEILAAGVAGIDKRLARLEEKEKISAADRAAALGRIRTTVDLSELADADLIIEAVVEDLAIKNDLWKQLNGICGPEAIFASNTSSLAITDMAAASGRPERTIGLHFFNPVPVMQLVEVVRTLLTSDEVFARAVDFVRALGKEPVECRDSPGFIVNRLLVPFMFDAVRAVEQGVGTIAEMDRALQLGAGHPMGPLTLCDFVGIDTLEKIGEIMFAEYRETRFAPPPLLKRMVALGLFGKKSGKGFYDYSVDPPAAVSL